MTPEEFAAASKKATAEDLKSGAIGLVMAILGLVSTNFFFARLPERLTTVNALLSLLFFIILSAPWIFIISGFYRRTKRLRLLCPHCEKPFFPQDRKIVLSGGACCYCGQPVIERTRS